MSGQAGRYQRSFGGLLGALIVLVVVVVGWVVLRSVSSKDPDGTVATVDYAQVVGPARRTAPFDLLAPPSLPTGWRATTVSFTDGAQAHWHLGVLTGADRYVGLEQADRTTRSMVEEYVDPQARRGRPVDVGGRAWATYSDDGGDLALVRRTGRATTLVVGHDVGRSDLASYVASLR